MRRTKVVYAVRYDWYGYEGVGHCKCEYVSENISDIGKFIDDEQFRNHELRHDSNGHITRMYDRIVKRTTFEEIVDYKQELRNKKINDII